MDDALENHESTITINGGPIKKLRFADDIDGLAGSENELADLISRLDRSSRAYGMLISVKKEKAKDHGKYNPNGLSKEIKLNNTTLEAVNQFKYLGSIITHEGSRAEVRSRTSQAQSARAKLKTIWRDNNISLR